MNFSTRREGRLFSGVEPAYGRTTCVRPCEDHPPTEVAFTATINGHSNFEAFPTRATFGDIQERSVFRSRKM